MNIKTLQIAMNNIAEDMRQAKKEARLVARSQRRAKIRKHNMRVLDQNDVDDLQPNMLLKTENGRMLVVSNIFSTPENKVISFYNIFQGATTFHCSSLNDFKRTYKIERVKLLKNSVAENNR